MEEHTNARWHISKKVLQKIYSNSDAENENCVALTSCHRFQNDVSQQLTGCWIPQAYQNVAYLKYNIWAHIAKHQEPSINPTMFSFWEHII